MGWTDVMIEDFSEFWIERQWGGKWIFFALDIIDLDILFMLSYLFAFLV